MSNKLTEMTDDERYQLFPVILSESNPKWKDIYLSEENLLKSVIDKKDIIRISHFGSTSVPGLKAKPTIDILLELHEKADTSKLIKTLKRYKYIYSYQPDNPPPHILFYKGYTTKGFVGQAFHLHVRYSGEWDEIYFRNYLINHPKIAIEYAALKTKLAKEFEYNRDAYTEAKTDFIKRVTLIAKKEAKK